MARNVQSGSILEVRLLQRMSGQRLMNVLHYTLTADVGDTIDGDFITPIFLLEKFNGAGGIVPMLKLMLSSTWAFEGIDAQWIYPIRYTSTRNNVGVGPGAVGGPPAPQNVQATITKQSLFGSKHGKGSFHLGGMAASSYNLGTYLALFIVDLANLAQELVEDVDVSAVPGALLMTPTILNKAAPNQSFGFHEATAQNTVRVQRRRTVGLGE